jgi:hypothetical protein
MNNIYEYNVVAADDYNDFIESVDVDLKNGWICQGGIAVSCDKDGTEWLYQAMIRKIEIEKERE